MTDYRKVLGVFLVMMFGLWGCSRGTVNDGSGISTAEKIRLLEAKTAKLENELNAVMAANDQLRAQLSQAEHSAVQLKRQLDGLLPVVKERDELVAQVKSRTSERDQIQTQYDGFRRNIKELLGNAEASLPDVKKSSEVKAGLVSRPGGQGSSLGGGAN